MRGPQFRLCLSAVAVALWLCAGVAYANVYPSGIEVDASGLNTEPCGTASITYVLNENADGDGTNPGVKIEILDSTPAVIRTVTIARQAKGTHVFQWDGRKDDGSRAGNGTYTVRITATDFGYTTWTKTSDDTFVRSKYYSPKGVSVNRNTNSPNFGRIYVSEGAGGPVGAGGRTTTDGIYVMTADQGDVLNQGDTAFAGGIDWTTGAGNSPWKISVAPDDTVYISDWSDLHSGVWRCNADPQATFDEILTNAGRDSDGLVPGVHGSVASVLVEGTGADTKLFVLDEDYPATETALTHPVVGDILRYDIGTSTGYSSAPVAQTQDDTNAAGAFYDPGVIQNANMDFVRDEDGSWWISQHRYTDSAGVPSLTRFLDGATGWIFNSGVAGMTLTDSWGVIDIHDGLDLLAVGCFGGYGVYMIDISDPTNPQRVTTIPQTGYVRDVSFDEVGNLYVVSSSSETLRIWSPPSGVNSYTTTASSAIVLNKAGSSGPTITDQPDNVVACVGDSAVFSVAATGANVQYKWKKNGESFDPEETGSSLTLASVTAADGGAVITVEVCDDNGVVVSQPAILNVGVTFLEAPITQTVCVNTDATFTVNVSGKGTISYQWEKDVAGNGVFADITPGGDGPSVTLTNVQEGDSGTQIRCKVTDDCGQVTSPTAIMTVWTGPSISLVFALAWADYEINILPGGNSLQNGVYASGRGSLTYQWQKDGVNLENGGTEPIVAGATTDMMSLRNIPASWNGSKLTVLVTDECGTTDSNVSPGGDAGVIDVTVAYATENVAPDGCSNDVDDDLDGLTDCDDPDCAFVGDCGGCNDPFADADGDGDVDQADFSAYQLCVTGIDDPGSLFDSVACGCFDRDSDADVDPDDFAAFEACASAPGVAANPACDSVSRTVVINELSYFRYTTTPDNREFVELYNYGAEPVNISGWILRTSDTVGPPNDDNPNYRIADSTILPAGGYYVLGTTNVPNYNQVIGTASLFEDSNEAIELMDASGNVVDTVIYELNKGPVAISPAEGGIWMNFDSIDTSLQSLARWVDGLDTNNNGSDFGVRTQTPGASNLGVGSLVTAYVVPDVNGLSVGGNPAGLVGAFSNAWVIDPATVDTHNPNAISASPQGGNAIVVADLPGGNMVVSDDVCQGGASYDMYVYIDTTGYGAAVPGGESTTYGILGSTDPLYAFPNPDVADGFGGDTVTINGNTGLGWVYQKECDTSEPDLMSLSLCDFGPGGDSSNGAWSIVTSINLNGQASGWHRLKLSYNSTTGAVHAEFDAQTFDFTTATDLVGSFYVGYRESLATENDAKLRPATFDSVAP